MKVKDKVILVTGAGGGIGRELVLNLLSKGARVAAVDLRKEALKELTKLAGDKVSSLSIHVTDITDQRDVEKLVKEVLTAQTSIDGIINNAGIIQPFVKVNELDYESIDRVMNVNFYGTLYLVKSFLPLLLKRPSAHIVNVSSMGGFLPVPGQSVYGASKAAVKLFTEGLYAELKDTNVRVTGVFPGATETNIAENSGIKMETQNESETQKIKMNSPKLAAEEIIAGIEKDRFQVFVGADSKLMNLIYRISPAFATNLIVKQMGSLLKD